ncbi:E3 ubiquitin-protein ligase RNF216 [Colletotrichum sp. SAR 10_98]|nr:E3 ubiquitin-protein ligase RNF216 [Colletotrichum sp. SAR 10_98]
MADIEANIKSDCAAQIFAVFPDICPEYFEKTATELLYDVDKIIDQILGASSYPKKARSKSLKRKRESPAEKDEVSKVRQLYDFANRPPERAQIYISISKKVLSQDFPRATIKGITKLLAEHNNCLMQTYLALDEITRDWKSGKTKARFEFKKTRTPPNPELEPANLDGTIRDSTTPDRTRALEELRAARQVCEAEQSRRNSARAKVLEEENNFKQAQEEGTIAECGCCFDEQPLNRMVHCDNPDAEHRAMFLDDKLQAALDRIEFEAALQAQGFENLSACPFCPYAADCPPVEEDKEFRGGKKGNCPLFEQTEVRHEKEVRQAEEEARQKVLAAKPKLNEGLLKFNMSEHVTKGEKKTRSMAHIERGPQVVQRRHAGVDPVGEAMRLHLDPDALAAEQRLQAVIAGEKAAWNNQLGLHQAIAQNQLQAQPPEQPKPVRLARPAQPAQPAMQQAMALQHGANALPGAQNLAAGGPQIAAPYNPVVPRYPSKLPLPIQQPLFAEPIPPAAYQFQAGNNGNQSAQQRQPLAQHHVVWPHRDGHNPGRQVPNAAARAAPQAVNGIFGVPDAVANNNWNQLNMPPFGGGLDPFELDIGFELGLMAQQPANIDHSYPMSLFGAEANNPPVPGGMNFGNNAYGNPVNYVVQQPRDASELGRTRDNPLELD